MEKKREEMTLEDSIEWSCLVRDQVCADCGGDLVIEGVRETDSMRVVCKANSEHTGFRQRDTSKTDMRRGKEVSIDVREKIEGKMMVKAELQRALNLLAMRFPLAIRDVPGAALFINDCMRLGLDPLLQPAEAVPIPFKTKDKSGREWITVAMVVTEDGALSMAARGCPDEYDGSPATMPLLDYLMREHPQRSYEELVQMAMRTADELCTDPHAYVWVALGKRRSATVVNPVYGYYTTAEHQKAIDNKLPAGTQPGNQARVRAIKRWVRENFPESRQKMIAYTAELYRRSEGVKAAQDIIDAEYTVFITPLISPPGEKTGRVTTTAPTAKTSKKNKEARSEAAEHAAEIEEKSSKAGESAQDAEEIAKETKREKSKNAAEASAAEAPVIKGAGFTIEMKWLNKTLNEIKWSEDTAKTWLANILSVDAQGTLPEVLARLTRDQAEKFIRELQERAARVQPGLFD